MASLSCSNIAASPHSNQVLTDALDEEKGRHKPRVNFEPSTSLEETFVEVRDTFTWEECRDERIRNIITYVLFNMGTFTLVGICWSRILLPHAYYAAVQENSRTDMFIKVFTLVCALITSFYNAMLVCVVVKWLREVRNPRTSRGEVYLKKRTRRKDGPRKSETLSRSASNTVSGSGSGSGNTDTFRAKRTISWLDANSTNKSPDQWSKTIQTNRYSAMRNQPNLNLGRKVADHDLYLLQRQDSNAGSSEALVEKRLSEPCIPEYMLHPERFGKIQGLPKPVLPGSSFGWDELPFSPGHNDVRDDIKDDEFTNVPLHACTFDSSCADCRAETLTRYNKDRKSKDKHNRHSIASEDGKATRLATMSSTCSSVDCLYQKAEFLESKDRFFCNHEKRKDPNYPGRPMSTSSEPIRRPSSLKSQSSTQSLPIGLDKLKEKRVSFKETIEEINVGELMQYGNHQQQEAALGKMHADARHMPLKRISILKGIDEAPTDPTPVVEKRRTVIPILNVPRRKSLLYTPPKPSSAILAPAVASTPAVTEDNIFTKPNVVKSNKPQRPKMPPRQRTMPKLYSQLSDFLKKKNEHKQDKYMILYWWSIWFSPITLTIALLFIFGYSIAIIAGPIILENLWFEHACHNAGWDIRLDALGHELMGGEDTHRAYFHNDKTGESFMMKLQSDATISQSMVEYTFYVAESSQAILYENASVNTSAVPFIFPSLVTYNFNNFTYAVQLLHPPPGLDKAQKLPAEMTHSVSIGMERDNLNFPTERLWVARNEDNGYCGEPRVQWRQGHHVVLWTAIKKRGDCTQLRVCAVRGLTRRQVVVLAGRLLVKFTESADCCTRREQRIGWYW